jgi:hypothetical protein
MVITKGIGQSADGHLILISPMMMIIKQHRTLIHINHTELFCYGIQNGNFRNIEK